MTLPEKRLWQALRRLDRNFRRQTPLGRYIADFACLSARPIVELDGPVHALFDNQQHDAARDDWLKAQGYRVLHFRNEQVLEDLDMRAETILASLSAEA